MMMMRTGPEGDLIGTISYLRLPRRLKQVTSIGSIRLLSLPVRAFFKGTFSSSMSLCSVGALSNSPFDYFPSLALIPRPESVSFFRFSVTIKPVGNRSELVPVPSIPFSEKLFPPFYLSFSTWYNKYTEGLCVGRRKSVSLEHSKNDGSVIWFKSRTKVRFSFPQQREGSGFFFLFFFHSFVSILR